MIINSQSEKTVAVIGGESKQATLNAGEIAKLQYLLTKGLYSDPISAVIVEWANNAVDAVVQSGKDPIETPVIVEIGHGTSGHFLRVTDKGIGLDKETFENVCMNYLTSTKTSSNDYIGSFGIGMKSFMSLDRNAVFTCRKDGYEWKFNVYQGNTFVQYDLIFEGPTTEENGVICQLPIKDWYEYAQFKAKAIQKLAYYDTVVLFVDNSINPVENTILREEIFQYSTLIDKSKPMHMSLKDVYYEIDFTKLGIPTIYFPVCLRFSLEDGLSPTPSRESIIYDDHTKELILKKIQETANFFMDKFNNKFPEVDIEIDSKKALEYINNSNTKDKTVVLGGINFTLNNIEKYATVPKIGYKLKEVEKPLIFYKERLTELCDRYEAVDEIKPWGGRKRKWFSSIGHVLNNGGQVILVSGSFRGNVKTYLSEKHPSSSKGILFVKKKENFKRSLFQKRALTSITSYVNLLQLRGVPYKEWRGQIQEWQKIENKIATLFINETDVENSQDYLDWLEEKKKENKTNSTYVKLNKTEGDVTFLTRNFNGRVDKFTLKKVFKIENLHKLGKLLVRVENDKEEEFAVNMHKMLSSSKILFFKVGPRELKKLPKIHNIVTMSEFISEKSKPFRRIATACLIYKLLENRETVKIRWLEDLYEPVAKQIEKFKNYIKDENIYYAETEEVQEAILQIAEEKNLWDMEIIHEVRQIEAKLKSLEFIRAFNIPLNANEEQKQIIKKTINQILLFRKLYKGEFDDWEMVKKQKPVEVSVTDEEIEGEEKLEEEFLDTI